MRISIEESFKTNVMPPVKAQNKRQPSSVVVYCRFSDLVGFALAVTIRQKL